MLQRLIVACCVALVMPSSSITTYARDGADRTAPPIVIAHRGASGYVPEHTLAAFYIAIQQGVDYIEPDLVMSKDGVLIVRHENEIGSTTNVADLPQFSSRRRTKTIDGARLTGWFTEDFTLAELKTLRARERLPQLRTANTRFNDQFEIPTFEEVLALLRSINAQRAVGNGKTANTRSKAVGVYPETKHPSYFDSIGLSMERSLVDALHRYGYQGRDAHAFIQSFEVANLRKLRELTKVPLVQLIDSEGRPHDFIAAGDARSYDDLLDEAGLRFVATYADGIGVDKSRIFAAQANGAIGDPTSLVGQAHAANLLVHVWTLRAENHFLAAPFRSSEDPRGLGNMKAEARTYLETGIDGMFSDHPDLAVRARNEFVDDAAR